MGKNNTAISTLEKNQNNIIGKLDQHVCLSSRLIDNLNKTASLINHNQDEIARKIYKINQDFKKFE